MVQAPSVILYRVSKRKKLRLEASTICGQSGLKKLHSVRGCLGGAGLLKFWAIIHERIWTRSTFKFFQEKKKINK